MPGPVVDPERPGKAVSGQAWRDMRIVIDDGRVAIIDKRITDGGKVNRHRRQGQDAGDDQFGAGRALGQRCMLRFGFDGMSLTGSRGELIGQDHGLIGSRVGGRVESGALGRS